MIDSVQSAPTSHFSLLPVAEYIFTERKINLERNGAVDILYLQSTELDDMSSVLWRLFCYYSTLCTVFSTFIVPYGGFV